MKQCIERSPSIYITFPASMIQTSQKKGCKDCESQNTRKSAIKWSLLEWLHKKTEKNHSINGHVNV